MAQYPSNHTTKTYFVASYKMTNVMKKVLVWVFSHKTAQKSRWKIQSSLACRKIIMLNCCWKNIGRSNVLSVLQVLNLEILCCCWLNVCSNLRYTKNFVVIFRTCFTNTIFQRDAKDYRFIIKFKWKRLQLYWHLTLRT